MCGLIGLINRETNISDRNTLVKVFTQGLYADAVRGQHGTGICAVEKDGTNKHFKRALTSSDFLELSTAKKIIGGDNIFLMGHNRHATYGAHTDENSHPFINNDITLFHNGTLQNHSKLTPTKVFSVDSNAISYLLSTTNNTIKALEEINGAYALVWYDDLDKSINFARNKERPLFFGAVKGSTSLLYASEAGLIKWLADRNGIELDKLEALEVGKLLSIPLDEKEEITVDSFTPYEAPVVANGYYNKYSKKITIPGVVEGQTIAVTPKSWHSYNNTVSSTIPTNKYGYIKCLYKDDIYFHMSGVSETEKDKYLNVEYTLKVTSITEDKQGYGQLLSPTLIDVEEISKEKSIVPIKKSFAQKVIDHITQPPYVKGPGRSFISIDTYLKKVHGGCSNCTEDLPIEEAKNVSWDYEGNPYCPDCASFFNII